MSVFEEYGRLVAVQIVAYINAFCRNTYIILQTLFYII
jgi:hypothetical protein